MNENSAEALQEHQQPLIQKISLLKLHWTWLKSGAQILKKRIADSLIRPSVSVITIIICTRSEAVQQLEIATDLE